MFSSLLLALVLAGKDTERTSVKSKNIQLTNLSLSALMIGKLGMSVQDSIDEYEVISRKIFKHGRHRRGKYSKGSLCPRYCGKRFSKTVQDLFEKMDSDSNQPMAALHTTTDSILTHWYEPERVLLIISVADRRA